MSCTAFTRGGYGIANGNPEDTHWQIEQGYAPWWTYPKLLVAMWRPIGLLTHVYEFKWWRTPIPMHLHNLLWLALGVACAVRLYRGSMGPLVGGLAATLYASITPTVSRRASSATDTC